MKELNKKQKLFCEEYIKNGYNALKAYTVAYEQESKTCAGVGGSQLLKEERIREYIDTVEGSYRIVGYQEGITKQALVKVYFEMLSANKLSPVGDLVPDWTARHNAVQGVAKLLGDLTERKKIEIEEKSKVVNLDNMSDEDKDEYRKQLLDEL